MVKYRNLGFLLSPKNVLILVEKKSCDSYIGNSMIFCEKNSLSINKSRRSKKKCLLNIWVFPKIGVSQNGWFIIEIPIKMDDLEVPLFSETPISRRRFFAKPEILQTKSHPGFSRKESFWRKSIPVLDTSFFMTHNFFEDSKSILFNSFFNFIPTPYI